MLVKPTTSTTDNEYDEQAFVFHMKEEYVKHVSQGSQGSKNNLLDVVKLDFERLADFIRFEALKKKKLLTIDKIKMILSGKS